MLGDGTLEGDREVERPAVGETEGDGETDGVEEGELRLMHGFQSGGRMTMTASPSAPGRAAPPPPLKGVRVTLPMAASA